MKPNRTFCFTHSDSPALSNLRHYLLLASWKSVATESDAGFHDRYFDFDQKATEQLEYKHLLAQLVSESCPDLMPETYCINDANWRGLLSRLACDNKKGPWILKPSLLNNGQSIHLFSSLQEVAAHYSTSQRMGGEHVLQRYIDNPHLLRGAHKYSMRVFVILTNYAGAFVYPRGYCNVALTPFAPGDYALRGAHLTNEHLGDDSMGIVQIPSERFDFFPAVFPEIKDYLSRVMAAHEQRYASVLHAQEPKRLAIFGFDFMRDSEQGLWLLEANHGPCFPVHESHPLYTWLYKDFWQDFITSFVEPAAMQCPADTIRYSGFEKI